MFPFEIEILKALEGIRTPFLNALFEFITLFGEDVILIVLMACLYFAFDKNLGRKIFFSTALSLGTNCILKNLVQLPRPFAKHAVSCVRPETATGYSFPSGHTQTVASWSGSAAAHTKKRSWIVFCTVITLLTALSRIYLGAHYPSDVLVGALLGIAFALLGNYLYETIQNKFALCSVTTLLLTPFAIYYLCVPNTEFADFFKLYGLFAGFALSIAFEERFVNMTCDVSRTKRILRIVIGCTLAMVVKEVLKKLFACENLQLSLVLDGVRYFALAFVMLGICPWVYKKIKL